MLSVNTGAHVRGRCLFQGHNLLAGAAKGLDKRWFSKPMGGNVCVLWPRVAGEGPRESGVGLSLRVGWC